MAARFTSKGAFAMLEFRVRHTPARPGQVVCAIGEHPSLGCWDPTHALQLRQVCVPYVLKPVTAMLPNANMASLSPFACHLPVISL